MKILVAGSSGLIGSELVIFLRAQGHKVMRLLRQRDQLPDDAIGWDPKTGWLSTSDFEDFDAVINLSGETIASGRWSEERKKRIHDSRTASTRLLALCLAGLRNPPKVMINASAMGYYGNCGSEIVDEEHRAGSGFLAEVCQDWEAATKPAVDKGIRVVMLRFGIVLSPKGGALAQMLPAFKLGLGGKLGSGQQYMSWVLLEDVLNVIAFTLDQNAIQGPVNVGTPFPVTNQEFTQTLSKVLRKPAFLGVPAFALRLIFGQFADEGLLSSTRMGPLRLNQANFEFAFPHLEGALRHILKD
ncbi:MAG: TIGR01777 family protein [Parachlamydiaceae bacterium]|nr:TIGR01777 family protein [Parachlamydiaceae bacterium]